MISLRISQELSFFRQFLWKPLGISPKISLDIYLYFFQQLLWNSPRATDSEVLNDHSRKNSCRTTITPSRSLEYFLQFSENSFDILFENFSVNPLPSIISLKIFLRFSVLENVFENSFVHFLSNFFEIHLKHYSCKYFLKITPARIPVWWTTFRWEEKYSWKYFRMNNSAGTLQEDLLNNSQKALLKQYSTRNFSIYTPEKTIQK